MDGLDLRYLKLTDHLGVGPALRRLAEMGPQGIGAGALAQALAATKADQDDRAAAMRLANEQFEASGVLAMERQIAAMRSEALGGGAFAVADAERVAMLKRQGAFLKAQGFASTVRQ